MRRPPTAILYADVAGYSRHTARDEEATFSALKTSLNALTVAIKDADGRVVNYASDAVLARFDSVLGAVRCAADSQNGFDATRESRGDELSLQFLMGIHLGDVIVHGKDLFGDAINVAARLEQGAGLRGICISDDVYLKTQERLDVAFEDMGQQSFMNIEKPVRAYCVVLNQGSTTHHATKKETPNSHSECNTGMFRICDWKEL